MESDDIEEALLEYYKQLLGTKKSISLRVSQNVIQEGNLVFEEQQRDLCTTFSSEDVRNAMFAIDERKASGPNG